MDLTIKKLERAATIMGADEEELRKRQEELLAKVGLPDRGNSRRAMFDDLNLYEATKVNLAWGQGHALSVLTARRDAYLAAVGNDQEEKKAAGALKRAFDALCDPKHFKASRTTFHTMCALKREPPPGSSSYSQYFTDVVKRKNFSSGRDVGGWKEVDTVCNEFGLGLELLEKLGFTGPFDSQAKDQLDKKAMVTHPGDDPRCPGVALVIASLKKKYTSLKKFAEGFLEQSLNITLKTVAGDRWTLEFDADGVFPAPLGDQDVRWNAAAWAGAGARSRPS